MDKLNRIKFFGLLLCALVVVGGVLYLALSTPAQDTLAKPPQKEAQMLMLINQARKEAGVAPLTWDEKAAKVAAEKVADMVKLKYFAHISPKIGDLDKQFEKWGNLKLGADILGLGENLAQAQGYEDKELTPEFWHDGSMNSPEHRKNIVNPQFTHVGIALKRGADGKVFMAQMFIAPMNAGPVPAEPTQAPAGAAPTLPPEIESPLPVA